jgi:nitrilase
MERTGRPQADSKRVTVAIAQFAPVYRNKRDSLAKALDLIEEAARRNAQLVAFGESWLPGYPAIRRGWMFVPARHCGKVQR